MHSSECLQNSGQVSQLSQMVSPRLLHMNGRGYIYCLLDTLRSSQYKQQFGVLKNDRSLPK